VISPELRAYAETPDRFAPETAGVTRHDDGRVCVLAGIGWASVSGPTVEPGEVDELVRYTRELIAPEIDPMWWLGPSIRPHDIRERLLAAGLVEPRDGVGRLIAVALTEEPRGAAPGIDIRRVETYDDFVAARELQWDAFSVRSKQREAARSHMRANFEESMASGVPVGFLALLDGRPAGSAMSVPSSRGAYLIGGATAPWARGRGLYRALVRARWDDAVARGTPALVSQANPATSYPILKRLGFEDVCEIRRVEDVRQSSGSTTPAS
jgi:ribosomal protein S18 acetylase RimI-like enzyme